MAKKIEVDLERKDPAAPLNNNEEVKAPEPPLPPPPSPAQVRQQAGVQVASQPAVQATHTYRVNYDRDDPNNPMSKTNNRHPSVGAEIVGENSEDCIKYLYRMTKEPTKYEGYRVAVNRTGPLAWQGVSVMRGPVWDDIPAEYHEIRDYIGNTFGGGDYTLTVQKPDGTRDHGMSFSISTQQHPPKVKVIDPNTGNVSIVVVGTKSKSAKPERAFASSYSDELIPSEEDAHVTIRKKELATRAELNLKKLENEKEALEERIEDQREDRRRKKEAREMQPLQESAKTIERLEQMNRENLQSFERRMESMMSGMKDLVTTLVTASNKKDDGAASANMMIEAMKASQKSTELLITTLTAKNGGTTEEAITKMQLEFMKMMMSRDSKSDKWMELLLSNKLASPDDRVQAYVQAYNSGRTQMKEMYDMFQSIQADTAGSEESVIDNESGFLGNIGNVLLYGLRRIVDKAARGGGSEVLNAIAARLGKPPGTTQFSDAELQTVEQQLKTEGEQLGVPPPSRLLPGPTQTVQNGQARNFQQGAPTQTARHPYFANVYDVVDPSVNAQPSAQPETQQERTQDIVTEMCTLAVADLQDMRTESDWVVFGLAKLPLAFKTRFGSLADNLQRTEELQRWCDPQTWEQLKALLLEPDQVKYQKWMDDMSFFVREHMESANVGTVPGVATF